MHSQKEQSEVSRPPTAQELKDYSQKLKVLSELTLGRVHEE